MNVKRGEQCPHCGRFNSRHMVTNGVVVKNKKLLLLKRGIEPEIGKWGLPGGYVDWDETIEEAMVREVKEETGIDAKVTFMIGVYSNPKRRNDNDLQNVAFAFALSPSSDSLKAQESEVEDLRWFDLDNLPEELAFDHLDMVQTFLRKEEENGQ